MYAQEFKHFSSNKNITFSCATLKKKEEGRKKKAPRLPREWKAGCVRGNDELLVYRQRKH